MLRDEWHLVPGDLTRLQGGLLSRAWEFEASGHTHLARLSDGPVRPSVEAGLAAAAHLLDHGIAAGTPVRTLGGALTVTLGSGALAVLRRVPGRSLAGADPVDQQWWGDRLGAVHRVLQHFQHPGLRPWNLLDAGAGHLDAQPWLREAVTAAVTAMTRLSVTDRLTYGVLHGDPAPEDFVVDLDTGRAGILDCGVSGTGPLVYDVAAAVVYAGGLMAAGELLDGYLSAGPVRQDELEAALPVLLRFRWAVQADRYARLLSGPCSERAGHELRRAREALDALPG
ncbi:hypothetical protein GCM10012284_59330 [Mangrovihabitans endophyticus]|uniref:Hydroxylysine kinase n=2 Tax=Mangrovihabitans endophyticus TaxID=1751298 RepID=A0A8J3FSF3_9ACTN|nr:hypothetical protein GCM10012284_59330 [Mangrovihabitans endophyticus]